MFRSRWLNKKTAAVLAVVVLLVAAGAWWQRTALCSWFYVRQLVKAGDDDRGAWAERVAGLGEAAVPALLECLSTPDAAVCRNARAALARLTQQWGAADSRTVALAMRCGRDFQRFSPAGQQDVLLLAADWFRQAPADTPIAQGLLPASTRLLAEAGSAADTSTQANALELCAVLLAQRPHDALSASRELVRRCLASASPGNRVRAVQLALRDGMDLYEPIAALLSDPAVEVRRAALLAVGLADVVLDDALLPSLHDPDPEIRQLCETALKGRERTPQQIRLGYLLTAPDPVERIQVVAQLSQFVEGVHSADDGARLDPTVWLTRLSHDPSPAIRAAAARAMSQLTMTDRLEEMARTDPSATVCLLAKYYLTNAKRQE